MRLEFGKKYFVFFENKNIKKKFLGDFHLYYFFEEKNLQKDK